MTSDHVVRTIPPHIALSCLRVQRLHRMSMSSSFPPTQANHLDLFMQFVRVRISHFLGFELTLMTFTAPGLMTRAHLVYFVQHPWF